MSTDYILNNSEGLVSECCGGLMQEDLDRCPVCFDNCTGVAVEDEPESFIEHGNRVAKTVKTTNLKNILKRGKNNV